MPARKTNEDAPPIPTQGTEEVVDVTPGSPADEHREDAGDGREEQTNVVRYLGKVTERRITQEDFAQAGVSEQEGAVWTKDSGYVVPIDHFSEQALTVLASTGEFEIVREQ